VHLGAAERLVVTVLAGRHLHQWRTTEEDLGPLLHQHDVVAHARHVGAPGRRVAEDQCDRRDARRRHLGEVAEHRAAGDEDLGLRRQVGATGLDEIDQRQTVLARDLHRPPDLLAAVRVARAAAHGGVVRDDQDLDALHQSDAGHHARADREARAVRRDRHQVQERRIPVEQQFDPLAREQLSARAMPVNVVLAAAGAGRVQLLLDQGQLPQHRVGVGLRVRAARVHAVGQHGHAAHPSAALTLL